MVEVHIPVLAEDEDVVVQEAMQYPTSTPHLNSFGLVIRNDLSSAAAGRGVYATRSLPGGTVVEVSPVLLFPPGEYEKHGKYTQLDGYTFVWKRTAGQKAVMALALGLGSLFNHSKQPNLSYTLDHAAHCIHYRTVRDVRPDEELTISYGAGRMWWEPAPSQSVLDLERKQQLIAVDPAAELSRLADMMGSSESEDEDSAGSTKAGPSSTASSQLRAVSNKVTYPPLYRITAARDPHTLPLDTRSAWIIDIDPRKASSAIRFLQRHSRQLQNRDDGRYSTRHLRSFKTPQPSTCDGESRNTTHFLVCLQEACPDRKALIDMLSGEDAGECFGARPEPYLRLVPRAPAPTRERHAEWQSVWPCLISSAATNNASSSSAAGSGAAWKLDMGGGESVSVVDRAADRLMWEDPLRLQWAVNRFRRCIALARHALAHNVDSTAQRRSAVASAVHVTHPFEQAKTFVAHPSAASNTRSTSPMQTWQEREEYAAWTQLQGDTAPIVGRVTPSPSTSPHPPPSLSTLSMSETQWHYFTADAIPHYRSPMHGVGTIEVDALDQRIAKRNPLKHAVIEAIARVSILRTIDRTASPSATIAATNHPNSSNSGDSGGGDTRSSNGGDYLLTGLVMFCLYEPCVYCTMALVHSRVREVYFLFASPGSGGCCGSRLGLLHRCDAGPVAGGGDGGGIYALQEQKGLNHAFTVWRWTHPTLTTHLSGSAGEDLAALQRQLNLPALDP